MLGADFLCWNSTLILISNGRFLVDVADLLQAALDGGRFVNDLGPAGNRHIGIA